MREIENKEVKEKTTFFSCLNVGNSCSHRVCSLSVWNVWNAPANSLLNMNESVVGLSLWKTIFLMYMRPWVQFSALVCTYIFAASKQHANQNYYLSEGLRG